MAQRINTHKIETDSHDFVRMTINSYFDNGDALVRGLSEKDYGVDFLLEMFSNGTPTGKVAFLQVKGTEKDYRGNGSVSCPGVSESNLYYAKQKVIPVFLIYVFTKKKVFFFVKMQDINIDQCLRKARSNKTKTTSIKIPHKSNSLSNLKAFFDFVC